MSIRNHNQKKFQMVKNLQFPIGEYIITGSGPMGARNLKKIGDIDLFVSDILWTELSKTHQTIEDNHIIKIEIPGTEIEILYEGSFLIQSQDGIPSASDRIKEADIIDGLPFESLENSLYFKRLMSRKKDLEDIKVIETYLAKYQSNH